MLVNSLSNTYKFQSTPNCTSFKQGLTRDIVTRVKNMPPDEYQRITHKLWKKYGMIANVGCSNTVAFCVEKTADIMNRAGYILPKHFEFCSLSDTSYGEFDITHKVRINSDRKEYLDLEQLNEIMEKENTYNDSKHFLDSYLHEFLHAAHCNNIIKNKGYKHGCDLFWEDLSSYKAYYTIRQPLFAFIKNLFPQMLNVQITESFPEKIKLFLTDDLTEYFAQINAKKIGNRLGENFDIKNVQKDTAQSYTSFPENWNIKDEARKITKMLLFKRIINTSLNPKERDGRIKKFLDNILNYFEGEIWNGNVDNILNYSHAIRNYGAKKCK